LPFDKKELAAVMLDGIRFYQQTLNLKRPLDELLQLALDGMVQALDPHSGFLNLNDYSNLKQDTEGSFGGVGIEIGIRDGFLTVISPMAGTPAERAGLQAWTASRNDDVDTTSKRRIGPCCACAEPSARRYPLPTIARGRTIPSYVTIVREKSRPSPPNTNVAVNVATCASFNSTRATAPNWISPSRICRKPGGLRALVIDLRKPRRLVGANGGHHRHVSAPAV
jgi:carboxyl-terminal processing protease